MSETSPAAVKERGRRKVLVGIVVSVKMDKTAVVSVERREPHPLYRKIVRSTKRYKAHDPQNAAVLGDVVRIEETRPISKDKRWRIAETLVRGNVADVAPREIGAPEEALLVSEQPAVPAVPAAVEASEPEVSEPEASAEEAPQATELAADEAEATGEAEPEAAIEAEPEAVAEEAPEAAVAETSAEEKGT